MKGTSAQKSVPRSSVCTAGERDELEVVKLGRNARKKRIVRGFDIDMAIPRRKSRMPRAVAGRRASGDELRKLRMALRAIENGELFIKGMHISPYDHGNLFNVNPLRVRKLLLHKKEITHLYSTVKLAGYSIVPLSIYFKGSLVKLQIGLCKGKKFYDKRDDAAKRDAKRAIDRALKQKNQ